MLKLMEFTPTGAAKAPGQIAAEGLSELLRTLTG